MFFWQKAGKSTVTAHLKLSHYRKRAHFLLFAGEVSGSGSGSADSSGGAVDDSQPIESKHV